MATANQIKYRIGQAKKTMVKLNKEVSTTKTKIKNLESALKKAKAAPKAKPKKKVTPKKKRIIKKRKAAPKRKKR